MKRSVPRMLDPAVVFSPTIIANLQWPLTPEGSPPMLLKPMEELPALRCKALKGTPVDPLVLGVLPAALEEEFFDQRHTKGQFGRIALALVLLGYGYTDECHSIVLPLSWPDNLVIGHGPPLYHDLPEIVKAYATYVHGLVHRREAFNLGEFGMAGFTNAKFWASSTRKAAAASRLPHSEWQAHVVQLAKEYSGCGKVQGWCQRQGFIESDDDSVSQTYFDPQAINDLCATILGNPCQDSESEQLREFGERLCVAEIQILLHHVLEMTGHF